MFAWLRRMRSKEEISTPPPTPLIPHAHRLLHVPVTGHSSYYAYPKNAARLVEAKRRDDEENTSNSLLSTLLTAEVVSSAFESLPSPPYDLPSGDTSSSFDFGGGDSGGGGASGDYS